MPRTGSHFSVLYSSESFRVMNSSREFVTRSKRYRIVIARENENTETGSS